MKKCFLCASAVAAVLSLSQTAFAQTSNVSRTISFDELGYRNGVTFERLFGEQTFFIPVAVPEAVTGAAFSFDLVFDATRAAERYLKVRIDDVVVAVEDLGIGAGSKTVTVDVSADAVQDGFVKLDLFYSGAASEAVCIDDRTVGDFLRIEPGSGLVMSLDTTLLNQPDDLAAMMPPIKVIGLAEGADATAFALRAATLNGGEAGLISPDNRSIGSDWTVGRIDFALGNAAPSVIFEDGKPSLVFTGATAQAQLAQLNDLARPFTSAGVVALTELGFDASPANMSERRVFEIPFDRGLFGPGLRPTALDLSVIATPDSTGKGAALTILLNGEIIAGRTLRGGQVERIVVDLPRANLSRENLIEVVVQREPLAGNCTSGFTGYPVQILPQSGLQLTVVDQPVASFSDLYQAFSAGAEVVLDDPADLDWAMAAAGAAIPDAAGITVISDVADLSGNVPFMIVSKVEPAGVDARAVLNGSRIEITDADGGLIYDGAALENMTVAQIIAADGQPGLWLRPGIGAPQVSQSRPLNLGNGDVALFEASGRSLTFSTRSPDIASLNYPDQRNAGRILADYRAWIFGALWLALTVGIMGVLVRYYRGRNAQTPDADS